MINFIDLLNWAATIFVWVLGVGIVGNLIMWLLGGFAPKSKPQKEDKDISPAWHAWLEKQKVE